MSLDISKVLGGMKQYGSVLKNNLVALCPGISIFNQIFGQDKQENNKEFSIDNIGKNIRNHGPKPGEPFNREERMMEHDGRGRRIPNPKEPPRNPYF